MKIKNTAIKFSKATDFEHYLSGQLKDEKLKAKFNEFGKQLEIAYQIVGLRKRRKMSQFTLAKKIGTTQSNIARLESGRENFTIGFLKKIAVALNGELKVSIK
jgi:ribosome-binding protein aMBF1 (putative translation factor)